MAKENRSDHLASKGVASRRTEKIILLVAAAINVIMASVTMFIYSPWFKDEGYAILGRAGRLADDMATVNGAATVAQSYGFLLLILGAVSFIVALRAMRPSTIIRGVQYWMIFCMVFSLATADWLSLIAYALAFVAYVARNKAIRRISSGRR